MIRAALRNKCEFAGRGPRGASRGHEMSYVKKSLVPGETLLYETRHHWIVLLGPLLMTLVFVVMAVGLVTEAFQAKSGKGVAAGASAMGIHAMELGAIALLLAAIGTFTYGVVKRNATEMAVTNKRVLIKTGMGSRRTLDLMLSRVESIGVEETFTGRMLGFGSVVVRGTGGTPESFVLIAHPQEFRRNVQEQIGAPPQA
jgi:uncharacterized membrane protein YdbT with pleckstrin-like domain